MKYLLWPALWSLAACAAPPPMHIVCELPRPEVCNQAVAPVCATDRTGADKTVSNACIACRDMQIVHYIPQACDVDPLGATH